MSAELYELAKVLALGVVIFTGLGALAWGGVCLWDWTLHRFLDERDP